MVPTGGTRASANHGQQSVMTGYIPGRTTSPVTGKLCPVSRANSPGTPFDTQKSEQSDRTHCTMVPTGGTRASTNRGQRSVKHMRIRIIQPSARHRGSHQWNRSLRERCSPPPGNIVFPGYVHIHPITISRVLRSKVITDPDQSPFSIRSRSARIRGDCITKQPPTFSACHPGDRK